MTDNVVRREVQRRDDPFGIPACFYWTMDEVADWVDSIGYGKYKENFRSHFINGRKLLTVDACVLPRMGITHFGDILGLCKHIREVLGIRRHLHDYNPWQPRASYISMVPTSGKKQPHLSYREHAKNVESIVQARLQYFKKRNYCYTGWSMEQGWDKKLKHEEKIIRDQFLKSGVILEDATRKHIGKSMQERLRAAADRLLSYEKESRQWISGPDVPTKSQLDRFRDHTFKEPSELTSMNSTILGQTNWSPIRNVPYCVTTSTSKGRKACQKKVEVDSFSGIIQVGELKDGNLKKKKRDVHGEHYGNGIENREIDVNRKDKEDFRPGTTETKEVKKERNEKIKPFRSKTESTIAQTKKGKNARTRKKYKDGESATTSTDVPVYHVSTIFHWKKMETSQGYPPLRLDQLLKCGYYNVQSQDA